MSVRLLHLKSLAIAVAGLVAACLLFAWLALPRIIQSQAESYIAGKAGHRLSLDRPEFNPLDLSLRVANLRLAGGDGKPLLGFRNLLVDLSAASIFRRAWVFDLIRLEEPEATVALDADGRLNWSPLIDALKGKDEGSGSSLPRLDVQSFTLSGGTIAFADQRVAFSTRVQPLDVELSDISTLPDDQGRYQVSAHTAFGARVLWRGEATLNPLVVAGSLAIDNLELASLAPYLKDAPAVPSGLANLATGYRLAYAAGRVDLTLDKLNATVAAARLKLAHPLAADITVDTIDARDGRFDLAGPSLSMGSLNFKGSRVDLQRPADVPVKLLQLGRLDVADVQLDLAGRNVSVGSVALSDGRLKLARDEQGRLDVLAAWQPAPQTNAANTARTRAAPGWRYRVNKLELSGFSASLRDQSVTPAAEFALEDMALGIDGISENLAASLPLRVSFRAGDGGSFAAIGKVVPAEPAADLKLKLADWSLKPVQPYLTAQAALTLASGLLGVEGRAIHGQRGSNFKGSASLRDLRLNESATGELFLAWKSLAGSEMEVTTEKLQIKELTLDGVDTKVLIHKDKSVNVGSILRKKAAAADSAKAPLIAAPSASATADSQGSAPPFEVNVDRLRVRNGEMDFEDHSLTLPFGTRIHRLRGAVIGLSSRPGAPGQVELEGQVDDYGLARAIGQMDFFDPKAFTDLKVIFRNVEMTRLTPYSATFAGRKIDSGKLSLDLEYKIKKHQIAGDNQIIMDQLTLGERVDSPGASSLPLDLAVALLQDADGRIDLGLPVSGSLDDPQFNYGALIWKALINVIGKIATAPFRALGGLLGGGEKFESIAFEFGDAQLTPPEREKLVKLANALNKRPGLSLTLHGVYAEADRISLQDKQLRRAVALRSGQRLEGQEHAGPLSTRSPAVRVALEGLYAERVGATQFTALQEGFRKANPGQFEQGAAGRMMSRLSGLVRQDKPLSEQEVTDLKGADFHAVLFERLRDRETVAEAQLSALAKARGENAAASLKAAGAPAERLTLAAPERVNSEGREVPLKLVLGAAAKVAAPARVPD